jgi:hypothetical protein
VNSRLTRIEALVVALTATTALVAVCFSGLRPLGIILGGAGAWLDFVVIRRLVTFAFSNRPALTHVVPMALAKSFALIAVPAVALLLPASLVDGVSFAIGVTALPAAVVIDALNPLAVAESIRGDA